MDATETTPLVVHADARDGDVVTRKKQQLVDSKAKGDADVGELTPVRQLVWEEAVGLVQLSIPITLMVLLEFLPLIVVAMMIGNVSGDAAPQVLAAMSLSDFFQSQVFVNVTTGLSAAVATLCAQAFGAQQPRQLWLVAQAGLLASAYTAVPILILSLNGATILTLLGQDPALARLAGVLILIGLASQVFYMAYAVIRSALQAQNIATPFVAASLVSYGISLPLAYVLGYHTSLGYIGIALSIVVSSILKLLVALPVLLTNELYIHAWPGWQWREAHVLALRLWRVGAGSVLMATFQSAGFNVVALLCGYFPMDTARVMTASSIASALLAVAFLPMVGLCAGGTVRVSNALGARQPRRASLAGVVVIAAMLLVAIVGVAVCWGFADAYARAYTSDAATIAMTVRLTQHLLLLVPLVGLVYAAQSLFQACGAQWLGAQLNFLFLFAVGVPLGLVLAFSLDGGVFGLWDGQVIGALGFVVAAAVWLGRLDWHATAYAAHSNAHLHVDQKHAPSSHV